VVTGAGTGMGRELARQLAAEGCHVAMCDVLMDNLVETTQLCEEIAPANTRFTTHECDVSAEDQVVAFCVAVQDQHKTGHINLLFNNAGIGGGGSFIQDDRGEWEKTFGVSWFGVYYCTRAFMPLLVAATEGHIVNLSSVNGFWACLGPIPHTAYSSAKFAIKGFSEALLMDLRVNAPHVKVSVVMPGHIGTSIAENSRKLHGHPDPADLGADDLRTVRERMGRIGMVTDELSDTELRALIQQQMDDFHDTAPLSAEQAATIILDGVREEKWRILVGEDAKVMDRLVREFPEEAYEPSFLEKIQAQGQLDQFDLPGDADSKA
jgi:NAD(P)-dependent dehydrogenase (short-subunit alcohol dehydrogenase family)